MRRNILSAAARPSRSLTGRNYPRRTFTSTMVAQEQVHPIGPFYEAILRSPPFIPVPKPEAAPVSSAPEVVEKRPERPEPTPTVPVPATPAAEKQPAKVEQPKKEETPAVETPSKPAAAPKTKTKASAAAAPKEAQDTPAPDHDSINNRESNSQSSSDAAADTPESRARVIFSSSLVGPAERAERLAAIKAKSRLVAGVLVPPKPEEPDNCCMSGCVNCVWERYRDELEDWASASAEADRRLLARDASSSSTTTTTTSDIEEEGLLEGGGGASAIESVDASMAAADRNGGTRPTTREEIPAVGSMDDDGGGSETNWTATTGKKPQKEKEFWNEELYKNVPVGIREFMKQEKRLKEKHLREGTLGG
ncbi:oxidoreductase-like domain containing protein [Rhypophila sp. PSN 637]